MPWGTHPWLNIVVTITMSSVEAPCTPNSHPVYHCPYMSLKRYQQHLRLGMHSSLSGAKLFCVVMQMTAFIKGALLVIHCVPYHSFPQSPETAASTEVCQQLHQPLSMVSYQAKQGVLGMTCQAAHPLFFFPLCVVGFFVLILWSAFSLV